MASRFYVTSVGYDLVRFTEIPEQYFDKWKGLYYERIGFFGKELDDSESRRLSIVVEQMNELDRYTYQHSFYIGTFEGKLGDVYYELPHGISHHESFVFLPLGNRVEIDQHGVPYLCGINEGRYFPSLDEVVGDDVLFVEEIECLKGRGEKQVGVDRLKVLRLSREDARQYEVAVNTFDTYVQQGRRSGLEDYDEPVQCCAQASGQPDGLMQYRIQRGLLEQAITNVRSLGLEVYYSIPSDMYQQGEVVCLDN